MSNDESVAWGPSAHAAAAIFEDEAVLYDGSSNSIVRINSTAAAVWQRCDGRTPLRDVIDDLAETFGAPRAEVAGGVRALVADLTERGFLEDRADNGA